MARRREGARSPQTQLRRQLYKGEGAPEGGKGEEERIPGARRPGGRQGGKRRSTSPRERTGQGRHRRVAPPRRRAHCQDRRAELHAPSVRRGSRVQAGGRSRSGTARGRAGRGPREKWEERSGLRAGGRRATLHASSGIESAAQATLHASCGIEHGTRARFLAGRAQATLHASSGVEHGTRLMARKPRFMPPVGSSTARALDGAQATLHATDGVEHGTLAPFRARKPRFMPPVGWSTARALDSSRNDDARPWLAGFVNWVGPEQARSLLAGAGLPRGHQKSEQETAEWTARRAPKYPPWSLSASTRLLLGGS
jgi:hypothetical protein